MELDTASHFGSQAGRSTVPRDIISPAVIFAGWTNVEPHIRDDDDDLAPELWRYTLPPLEQCQKLDLQKDLYALELDLHLFVVVGGRFFFFGRRGPADEVYNVCVEVKRKD